ncbi:MAG TPA: hypothetical protein VK943_07210 [Arenibaculum sp.]|nr:hypothetical protein [Arenibaculum sp.]
MLAALAGLAACANPRADDVLRAQDVLVGMPAQTLLSCAGVPDRRASVDNLEYFTYATAAETGGYGPSTSVGLGLGSGGSTRFGLGLGFPLGGGGYGIAEEACEATFTLRDGTVEQVRYTGASSGSELARCYPIVENCLALVPAAQASR